MNRGDVVRQIADQTEVPITIVDVVLGAFFDNVGDNVSVGEDVSIRKFGKFEPRHRRAIVRKNPRTGDEIAVPAKLSIGFIPSDSLKARLNQTGRRNGKRARR
jgi:nucleoid DNA-binding protein